MHDHYGMTEKFRAMDDATLRAHLEFRIGMQQEETAELHEAYVAADAEGIVDALIDGIVFAIGTLDAFGVDAYEAWDAVLKANMSKEAGVKPERPNPLGLPDLIKPAGWEAPSHEGNHGLIDRAVSRPAYGPCEV
jgi:predicted HAD superfamily Cof-like phosphohydrolase